MSQILLSVFMELEFEANFKDLILLETDLL